MTAGQVAQTTGEQGFVAGTLPQLLRERASTRPGQTALRHKKLGIWNSVSWATLAERVEAVAFGLHELGLAAGDVVCVVSDNCPDWVVVELAAQSLRAAVVGPHPDCSTEELASVLAATDARVVVVEDSRRLEQVPPGASATLVCLDARNAAAAPGVRSLDDLEASGAAAPGGWWAAHVAQVEGADVALLALPSRAGATPEQLAQTAPVRLTHANLLARTASELLGPGRGSRLRWVSVLPLGWVWEQTSGLAAGLVEGFALSFPEGPSTQRTDLRDIGPDVLLAPARAWEAMAAELQAAAADAGRARGRALDWAMASTGAARRLADPLVLRSVRDRVGMTRVRRAWSFGAPLREDVQAYFASVGVDLRQVYGADIAGGAIAAQTGASPAPGAVGPPLPGAEVRVSGTGELLVRSLAASSVTADADGWVSTGDRGSMTDGQVTVLDRADDVLVLDGTPVSPSAVEARLRGSRYVEDAVVVPAAGSATGLSVLVVLDPRTTAAWAEQERLLAPSYESLTQSAEVGELVRRELAAVALPEGVTLQRCVILPRRLDAELDELTRTLVVRRRVVLAHFPDEVTALAATGSGSPPVRVLELAEEGAA